MLALVTVGKDYKKGYWTSRPTPMDVFRGIIASSGISSYVILDAFELWCWRRVLRVSWMERKTNIWIIENIKPEWTLESRVSKAALSYFGHVVRAGGMEDDVMLGRMN